MALSVPVRMKRGGTINLNVDGWISHDKLGSGEPIVECEIYSISWPGGGEVADKNIFSLDQVQDAFIEASENAAEAAKERAYDY
jgi:hypothetical protein